MIKNFKDIVFDNETLALAIKSMYIASFTKACNSPKYLVIDWRDVIVEDLNLVGIDPELLYEYVDNIEFINNISVLGHLINLTDRKDPETLWVLLVDNDHTISDELYCKNSFYENMAILKKVTNFKLPL